MSELVDEWLSENEPTQKVRQNALTTTQTPDDAARTLKLAERTGSNSIVASVYEDALLQADMAKRATKAAEVPGLGSWLEDQQNYAVAQDDLDHLPWWESMTPTNALVSSGAKRAGKSLKAEYDYGWNNIEASGLRLRNDPTYQALGAKPLTDKEKYRLLVLDGKKEPEDRVPFLGPAAKQIPNFLNQIVAPVTGWQEGYMQQREAVREGYRTDGVLGAVREQILKAPDPVVGLVRGFFSPTFVPEAGGAYQELSSVRDDAGKPIDQNTIAIASMAVGGLNTAIELYSDVALAAAFGLTSGLAAPAVAEGVVAKEAAKLAVKETAKKSLMRLTTQKAFERAGLELAKTVGIQNAEEIAQETVTMAAVQLSKELSGGTWKPADPSEIMERYAQIIWETTQSSLVFGAVGAGVHYAVDAQAIKQANEAEAMMEEMGRQSSESKLRARMPAKYAQAVQSIRDANGGALSEVPIDADRFVQYFQDQGVDPAAIAEELGVPASALQQAYSTGGTVDISIGQYAAKIAPTQHHKALYEHARILAGGRSIAEAREIEQTGDHFMRMAEQIRKESEDKVALSRSEEKVRDAVLEDLKAAGIYRPEIARQQVELPVALWTVMGKRLGVDPYAAFSERRLRVRGEVAGVKMEMADADLSQVREQAAKYGSDVRDWMLDRAEGKSPAETADYWVSQGAVDLNDTTIDQALRRTRTAIQKKLDSGLTRAEVADQYNVSEEVIEALFAKQAPGRKPNLQREVERLMREYPDLGLTEMTARLRNISGLENTEKNTVKVVKSRINKRMREDQTTLHQADGAGLTPFWIKVGVTNEHVEVLPNPSMSELRSILMQQKRDGEPMSVRFLVTEDGTVYAWDGGKVWHQDVLDKLGLRADQVERGEVNDPKDLPIINEIASTKRGPDLYQSVKGYDPYGERRTDLENRIEEASQVLGQKFSDFRRNRPARDANLGKSGKRDAGRADRARGDGNAAGTGPSLEEAIGKITAASSVRIFKNPPTATGRFGQYQVRLDVPVEPDASWNATVYGVFDSYIEFDTMRSGRGNQPADVGPRGDIQIKWSTTAIDVRDTGLGKFLYRQLLDWAFSENRRVFSDAQLSPASQILYGRKLAEYGYEVVAVAPDAEFDSTGWLRSPSRQPLFEVRPRPDATPYAHAPMDGLKIDGPSLRQRLKDNDQTTLNQPAGPIYYSALQRAVETSKQAKAPAAQWKAVLSKAPGIKKEEIEWSGVNDWLDAQEGSVTREALAAYLDQNGVKVEEVVKGAPSGAEATQIQQKLLPAIEERDRLIAELDDGGDEATINPRLDELQALISELSDRHYNGGQEATKWSSYTLPGGSNYRELLLTLPMKDRQGFEDYLARYRAKYPNATTTDAEVRQFHNQGVPLPGEGAGFQRVETTGDVYRSSHWSEPNVLAHVRFDERTDVNGKRTLLIHEVQSDKGARWRTLKGLIEKGTANESQKAEFAVLDAMPFNKTNDYSALIFKRMIRWASENGFDQVAWTPGQVQAERFSLVHTLGEVTARKQEDGRVLFRIANGRRDARQALQNFGEASGGDTLMTREQALEAFGKDAGGRMFDGAKANKDVTFAGDDLQVGGEGMKAFYDKVLPNIANDIGKKYGAKVGEGSVVEFAGLRYQVENQQGHGILATNDRAAAEAKAKEVDGVVKETGNTDTLRGVFTLPITPELRNAAMEGMPLFQGAKGLRGAISMPSFMTGLSAGETATMRLTEASDLSTYLHEFGHYALAVYQSIAAEEGAPQAIKDDMAAIHSWMRSDESAAIIAREASIYSNKRITKADVQNLENLTDDVHIWRASHELFSRTFEAYLMEGKAPSVGLRKAFASFKAWLMQVYKSLTLGGTNFAPEIKDVMDRMLATEEQIAEVRAQENMGIMTREQFPGTDKQWERYKEQGEAAREAAVAELQLEIMEAYVKQQRASWNVERRRIRKTVERDVDQNPARRAYDWLSRGVWKGDIERTGKTGSKLEPAWGVVKPPEGLEPMALDTGAVVEDYGPEALANLPREVKPENREAVDALVEDIRRVRKMLKRKKPRTLAEYVRDMGGLRDETGDVLAMIGTKQAFPGLIRPNGRYLDDAALSAWEGKYFGAGPGKGFMQYAIAQSNFDAVKRWVERHSPAMSEDWFAMRAAFEAELEAAASGPRGDIWTKARKELALAYWQDAVERARGVGSEDWARKASQAGIKSAEASLFGEMRSEGLLYQFGSGLDDQIGRAHWANSKEVHKFKGGYSFEVSNGEAKDRVRVYTEMDPSNGVIDLTWDFGAVRDTGKMYYDDATKSPVGLGPRPQETLGKIWAILERVMREQDFRAIHFYGLDDSHTRLYATLILRNTPDGWVGYEASTERDDKHKFVLAREGDNITDVFPNAQVLTGPITKGEINAKREAYKAARRADISSYAIEPGAQTLFQGAEPQYVALHNLYSDNLLFADEFGGLAVPSIGVTLAGGGLDGFGDITLIGNPALGDPEQNPIYTADAYSPRFPRPLWKAVPYKQMENQPFYKALKRFEEYDGRSYSAASILWDYAVNTPNYSEASSKIVRESSTMAAYLEAQGKAVPKPIMRDVPMKLEWSKAPSWIEFMKTADLEADNLGWGEPRREQLSIDMGNAARIAIKEWAETATKSAVDGRQEVVDSIIEAVTERALNDDGKIVYSAIHRAVEDQRNIGKREVDVYATRDLLEKRVGKKNMADYRIWIEQQVRPIFKDPYFKLNGKNVPFTPENVVSFMSGRVVGQEKTMTFGDGAAKAATSQRISSMKEMKNRAWMLAHSHEIKALQKASTEAMDAWRSAVAGKYGDTWHGLDAATRVIASVIKRGGINESNLSRIARAEGFKGLTGSDLELGVAAAKAFNDAPVAYFESKPQRMVALNEFAGAVVPTSAPKAVLDVLQKNGVAYKVYKKRHDANGNEVGARDAINSLIKSLQKSGIETLFQDDLNGRPTINQFLDALRADLQNRDHYSDADNFEVQEMLNAQENAAWYADRGIDINADAATMRQQIQNYLNSQWEIARHPDEIADIFGFESGEAFLKALANLKPRHEEIEAETNRRMIEENGDPFLDGTIAEEARLAAHNEVQARQIEIELEALQRAAGVSVASKAAKGAAAAQLQNMTIKQIKNADWFLAAERRASAAVVVALESGNYREAIPHKQRQLLNFWLYRLARDETKKIDRAEKRWKDLSNKESVRNRIDPDYRDKIDAILDGYEIRSSAQGPKRQWENQQLLEWVQQMKDQGLDHMVAVDPRIIQNAQRRPVNTLSLDEFNGLKDTIANLEHLGRLKDKLLNEQDKRRFEELIDDITKSIADNGPVQKSKSKSYSPTPLEAIDERRRQAHAQLSRPEFMFRLMDGLQDNGPVWRALFLPFAQAEDVETRLMSDMTTRIKEAFDRYTPRERAKLFTVRYDMPDLAVEGRQAYTRAELLSLALNWGNEGNRQAVLEGYGWTSEGVDRALTRLDERDWQVVQDIWRAIDSLWPEIAKMQKDLTGVVPEKVQAMPVQTRFGVIEGGYYPLKYDRTKNERVNQREEKKEVQELFGSNWMRPATRQGHTIERVGSNGQPVLLTLDVLTDHVRNAIHDIAFRKAVIDADRIIQNPRFQEAMIASVGREQYRQLRPWLQSIAADIVDPSTYWVKFLSQIRANTSIAAMGFKIGTATQQITGLINAIPRVGAGSLAKGFARMYANPLKTGAMWGFIRQRSEYMRNRRNNFDRDVRDAMNTMKKEGALNDVRRFAFVMVGEMDFMVSSSAWIAAYDNARAGKVKNIDPANEADAIAHADSVVRMTQTAGMPKDLPAVMRGAEGNKLFTAFYSFFSVLYNQLNNEQIAGVAMGKISKAQFAANMFMLMFFAPILAEALAGRLAPKDDEDWEDVLIREIPVLLFYYFSTIVGVRDLINAAGTGMDYQVSPVGSSLNAVAQTANAIGSGEADLGNEYTQKRAANAAGVLLGLPSGQAWITGDYVRDVAEGDEDPFAEPDRIITEGLLRDSR